MFKCGLKLWSINTESYPKEAKKLFEEGVYDFIELYTVPESFDTVEIWKNLDIPYIIHAPHYAHGLNLSNPGLFEDNLKILEETRKFADKLNADYIVVHPGVEGGITETARQLNTINDQRILIENKPFKAIPKMQANQCTGSQPDEIKYILENTSAGFCLDIGHAIAAANSLNHNYYEFIQEFIDLEPTMYHISDTDTASEVDYHYNFGKGNMNVEKILSMLPKNSIITIETNKASKDNLDDFVEDINYLQELNIENNYIIK